MPAINQNNGEIEGRTPSGGDTQVNVDNVLFQTGDKSFKNFQYCKQRVDELLRTWDVEINATLYRRRVRNISVNVLDLRAKGMLKPDETYIPVRLIDTNIKRDMPPKIAYLKQSRRLAIFNCKDDPEIDPSKLEEGFTKLSQYEGWELAYTKVIDGSDVHGWDAVEVCFDRDQDGKFMIDHVGHDNLLFPFDARKLQACPFIIRTRRVTIATLRSLVMEDGFDERQCQLVASQNPQVQLSTKNNISLVAPTEDATREIYKIFWKDNSGVVWVGWYGKVCSDWLKAPEPLYIGVRHLEDKEIPGPPEPILDPFTGQVVGQKPTTTVVQEWVKSPVKFYPFVLLFHEEVEEQTITDHKGRVWKDEYKQEASCALTSAFVNGCVRASNLHAAPKVGQTGASPKQSEVIIEHGKLWTEPVEFFTTPWPDSSIFKAAQMLDTQNSSENNQVSYTVNNREDSRKTATEVNSARQDQSLINGVNVTMFSIFMRSVLNICWKIVQSQALQGKVRLCLIPQIDPLTGEKKWVNDMEYIGHEYELFAAGDVDVVQRAEKLAQMMQDWPIVSQTPLAQEFLVDYFKTKYPNSAARYEQILRNGYAQIAAAQQHLAQTGSLPGTQGGKLTAPPQQPQDQFSETQVATQPM